MELVSVRLQLQENWCNYEPFCKVLCQIDHACKGEQMFDRIQTQNAKDVLILSGLLSMDVSMPNYITNCFILISEILVA